MFYNKTVHLFRWGLFILNNKTVFKTVWKISVLIEENFIITTYEDVLKEMLIRKFAYAMFNQLIDEFKANNY